MFAIQKQFAGEMNSRKSGSANGSGEKSGNRLIIVVAISVICLVLLSMCAQAEHHEDHKHHKFNPYKYGYKVIDHKGNKQWKQEESHSPMEVKGSYGYKDKHGMFREVSYIADKHGFRAHVKTNEPGTAPKSSDKPIEIACKEMHDDKDSYLGIQQLTPTNLNANHHRHRRSWR